MRYALLQDEDGKPTGEVSLVMTMAEAHVVRTALEDYGDRERRIITSAQDMGRALTGATAAYKTATKPAKIKPAN